MELNELVKIFNEGTATDVYMAGKAIQELIDAKLEELKPTVESTLGEFKNEFIGKKLIVSEVSKSTLDNKAIVAALTEQQLRDSYKATEAGLKKIGREDLIEPNKKITMVKQARVYAL